MSELIISVSGLRGIVGSQLTPEVVVRYLGAFAEFLPPGRLVVTRDGRSTGGMIADVAIAALRAAGRDVLCPGIAATPTTGVLVRKKQCIGGVQITASHNPAEYNGLKLMDSDGRVISAAKGEHVLRNYKAHSCRWADHKHVGDVIDVQDAIDEHLQMVLATVNVDRIREHQYSVLLNSNHGAGSILGKVLLERLGCRVRALGDTPDGHFEHPAEPTAENLATVLPEVVAGQADVGFCQDPDADRLAVIDETGRYVGEEYTLALCVDHVLRERPGPIVTNCSTSRMSRDLAEQRDLDQIGCVDRLPGAVVERQVGLALQIVRCGVLHDPLPRVRGRRNEARALKAGPGAHGNAHHSKPGEAGKRTRPTFIAGGRGVRRRA